jgi:YVTN family beta-propeller protein
MNSRSVGQVVWRGVAAWAATATLSCAFGQTPGGGYAVVERIHGPDGGWDYATVDPEARQLYLGRDEGVLAMNLETKKITATLVAGQGVHAALPVPGKRLLVVTNGDSNTATLVTSDTGKIVATLPTGKMPDAAAFEPKSGLVAVINHKGGSVTLIDPTTSAVAATVKVGGELEGGAAAGDGRLFVNVADKAQIAVVDVPAHKLVKTLSLKGCSDPSGLAYDARLDLLMSVCGNGVTKFLHPDGQSVGTLKTGAGSDGLLLDSERRTLFVPAGRDGTLTVISLETGKPTLSQTIQTQKSARLGALDARTGNVYLPVGKLGPPVPPDPWPSILPGTFEILVVAKK